MLLCTFQVFSHVAKNVDPIIFYHVQRPLLSGVYPDELTFEEVDPMELPKDWVCRPKGPSAGQSTMFVMLDMFLGIDHSRVAKEFQEETLIYMPRQHRDMVIAFQTKLVTSIRDFIGGKYMLYH